MLFLINHSHISSFYKNIFHFVNVPIEAIFANISSIIDWFSRSVCLSRQCVEDGKSLKMYI
jgi:hypothetical protein